MRRARRGLTLTELLVAMSIMLVGIYAVARGFPALFGNLESERIRTEMVRRVDTRMNNLTSAPFRIPDAVTGHDPLDGSVIPPELYPDESMDPIPGNPRDDLTWVLGETFQVPIAQPGQAYCVYPLNLGPAGIQDPTAVGDYLQVFAVEQLELAATSQKEWDDLRGMGWVLGDDQFFLDEDGYLYGPPQYPQAEVSYVWVDDNGEQHGVLGEVVDNANVSVTPNPVRATLVTSPANFVNVLPEMSSAKGLRSFNTILGRPADVVSATAVLDIDFGATLLLPGDMARETMMVNYQLMTEPDTMSSPRRVPFMVEEMAAPTEAPYRVDLAFRGINDQVPLFPGDVVYMSDPLNPSPPGTDFDPDVHVLVIDKDSGEAWTDVEDWVTLDYIEGRLTLDWDDASAPMTAADARGRDLRVYYRTIDEHTIVVQKAPAWFVEESIYQTYVTDGLADKVDYRFYQPGDDPDDSAYTRLLFPMSSADQMVTVDYLAVDHVSGTGQETVRRITGELHAIPGATLAITLNEPDVRGILAVRGVSMRVQGWWHAGGGRVEMVDLSTFLTPEPLL